MIVEILFGTGKSRNPPGLLGAVIKAYAALIALWVVYNVVITVSDIFGMMIVFLSAILVLVFLTLAPSSKSTSESPGPID